MTNKELVFIKQLLEALQRKCKTDALYNWTCEGLEIINRELWIKEEGKQVIMMDKILDEIAATGGVNDD